MPRPPAGETLPPSRPRRNPPRNVPPLATSVLLSLAAALVLDFTASGANGGSPVAVPVMLVLVAGHVAALGFRRWLPAPRFVIGRAGALAAAAVVALLALETLANQSVTVAKFPIRVREAANLGSVIMAAERLREGSAVYSQPLRMEGYDAHPAAMPGLLWAYLLPRSLGADWRLATPAGEALAAAFAVGLLVMLSRRPRPGMALVAVAAGGAAIFLLPSATAAVSWSTHAPVWAAIAAFGAGLAWGMPTLAGVAAGILAAMSVGWIVLLPAAFALLWSRDGVRSIPGLLLGGLIAATALLVPRSEFAPFLAGVVGTPALMADPRQAADLEPWRLPTLTGALTTFKLAPPLLVWAVLWALRAAWEVARGGETTRNLERFALAAFVVLICGPATTRFDLLSMALLGGGLLAAQLAPAPGSDPAPRGNWPAALAAALSVALLFAPVQWRLARPHELALDVGAPHNQSPGLNLLSGWYEPPEPDRAWSRGPVAEVAFAVARPAPATIHVDLSVPGGDYTPYNRLRIRLNQHRMGEWIAPPGSRFRAAVSVRDPDLFVRGPNVLSIESDWVRSERELGTGHATTPRGFAYHGLEFIPMRHPGNTPP